MCPELARYAESVQPGTTRAVVLRGGWGGDGPNILMTHDCKAEEDDPAGAKLCAYLVQHTSWEFGNYNAQRAATCLASDRAADFLKALEEYPPLATLEGPLTAFRDRPVRLSIRYEGGGSISTMTLSVTAPPNQ
jgi:hypothetical protein